MTDPKTDWSARAPSITLLLALLGILWGAAQSFRQLEEHNRRIAAIESTMSADTYLRQQNAERLARIEESLAYLVRDNERQKRDRQ